jgi:NAD(P)-dependent dehydrogenase (short-subunit alcohol dehydrogenase family)
MTDKIALVTGAATGIGAEVARQLAALGAKVAVCDVNVAAGQALADEIDGLFIECNVADFDAVNHAVQQCVEQLGVPDIAHLNAGVMTVPNDAPYLAIEDVSLEQYRRMISVNLDGVFYGFKSLIPMMKERGGVITVTASIAGFSAMDIDPLYGLSKHALIGFVRGVGLANTDTKLRVNAICPGVVDTQIVPTAFRDAGVTGMPPAVLAAEVLDLMENGAAGEIRVKMAEELPGFTVDPLDLQALQAAAAGQE